MMLKVNFTPILSKSKTVNEIIFVKNKNLKNKNVKQSLRLVLENKLFQDQLFAQKEYKNKNYIFINCKKIAVSSDYENIGSKLFEYLKKK